jgi:hypothetical protein
LIVAEVPKPPTLASELYAGLRLSPPRVRFMAIFTSLVCLVTVGLAFAQGTSSEATVDVDLGTFAVSGTAAFELQSLTDEFLNTLDSPSTIRVAAAELDVPEEELAAGITSQRDENATQVTVGYTDDDPERAAEVATVVSQTALSGLAEQRVAAASRDVDAADARLEDSTAALDAFEVEHGQRDIPGEFDRLTSLVDELTTTLAVSEGNSAVQVRAAIAEINTRRAALEPFVRPAESLEAERVGAQAQLLEATTRLSQAQGQLDGVDDPAVVRPGSTEDTSRLSSLITALATGLLIGVLGSYGVSWLVMERRGARTS